MYRSNGGRVVPCEVENKHQRFRYRSLDELRQDVDALGLELQFSEDVETLLSPLELEGRTIPNRLAVNPMEGV